MKEPTREGNYPDAGIGRRMDVTSHPDVGIGRHKGKRSKDTRAPSEKDNIRQTPRRKGGWAGARPPRQTNDLTCSEADVDDLLSAGELT